MIHLSFSVENVSSVIRVYNQIEVQSSSSETGPFTTVTGIGFPIWLSASASTYTADDSIGDGDTWYQSRYSCSNAGGDSTCRTNGCAGETSSWSDPILGSAGEICFDPTYPVEVGYGTSEQLVIDRIRNFLGDFVDLKREYNEQDNIHEDGKVYELETKGWPCSININGTTYNTTSNPAVNNYCYLEFSDDITTLSGVDLKIDVFYYMFRFSDREIIKAYNTAYPPYPLTTANATSEVYMLQTSLTLLNGELIRDSIESGATITDEDSRWSPDPGLGIREAVIDKLQKRLDNLVKGLSLTNITGVLLD